MEQQDFQNIIYRYFRGELNESEYEILTLQLKDPSNRIYFEQKKQEWNLNPEVSDTGIKNWQLLQYKISKTEQQRKIKHVMPLWVKISSIAAILILGLLLGNILPEIYSAKQPTSEQLVFETPRGEKSRVKLPDGSQVWLNASSRLIYHSFSSSQRIVELSGEAFFDVAHNENAPFIVKTNECEIKVLGTTFNVMAYDEFGRKEISLQTGKVNVVMEGLEKNLIPGQTLILKNNKVRIIQSDVSLAAGWIENRFSFKDIPLTELVKRLENWYDVDIELINKSGKEISFTGTFKNAETIWQVLDAIKIYLPIQYKKTELRTLKITVK